MKLVILHVPPSLNKVLRMHWTAKRDLRDNWILLIRAHLSRYAPVPEPVVKMRVKVMLAHSRPYDKDNAYGACKILFDALKHHKLIYDDSPEYLEATVEQTKVPHKQRHTIIDLEPA
jgi:hypothetical protein